MDCDFWIFWPEAVANVSFGFVFGEQFFKWFQFEVLAYACCVLYWYVWFRHSEPGPTTIALQTDEGKVEVESRTSSGWEIICEPPGIGT